MDGVILVLVLQGPLKQEGGPRGLPNLLKKEEKEEDDKEKKEDGDDEEAMEGREGRREGGKERQCSHNVPFSLYLVEESGQVLPNGN